MVKCCRSALKKQRVNGHAAADANGAGNEAGYSSDGERAELHASQELMDEAATFEVRAPKLTRAVWDAGASCRGFLSKPLVIEKGTT